MYPMAIVIIQVHELIYCPSNDVIPVEGKITYTNNIKYNNKRIQRILIQYADGYLLLINI